MPPTGPVSGDTLVGPPDREVDCGRYIGSRRHGHGGRSKFLRWHSFSRQFQRTAALASRFEKGDNNPSEFDLPPLSANDARPIAAERLFFAVLENRTVALDAATGEVVVEFGWLVKPTAVIYDGHRVIAADDDSVQAFNIDNGQQVWKVAAGSPNNLIADGNTVSFDLRSNPPRRKGRSRGPQCRNRYRPVAAR